MHSYYKKILLFLFLNTITTCCFTYIVTWNIHKMLVLTSGRSTVYPPFEYYYTWLPPITITE